MLKALLIWVITPSVAAQVSQQVKPQPRPQIEGSPFNTQQRDANQAPPQPVLTPQQITQAIVNGIATAAKQYEANHSPQPPDNSGWWVNFFLAIFTGALVGVGAAQCYIIFWTLKATRDAADAAKRSVIANNRAWLTVDVKLVQGQEGIIFSKDGAVLPIRIDINNVGNAPAIKVSWHAWPIFYSQMAVPVQDQLKRSNKIREQPFGIGPTIFPRQQFPHPDEPWSYGAGISSEEIDSRIGTAETRTCGMVTLVGCVDYTFSADAEAHHQTPFILHVVTLPSRFQIPKITEAMALRPSPCKLSLSPITPTEATDAMAYEGGKSLVERPGYVLGGSGWEAAFYMAYPKSAL
jgi:hypothetical protein